ncbi:single-stranded DNA-binding protein [Bacillus phage BSTP6]|uniref:Single-stranded DNA-binding protein n=1 Tax=Bacillus phage BSTP6 TaxID=2801531 RepID=A0A889INQ9_9CAUD|nr:single-stranded DNA-binding protein [Bacillus phage BSTP6]
MSAIISIFHGVTATRSIFLLNFFLYSWYPSRNLFKYNSLEKKNVTSVLDATYSDSFKL